MALQVKANVRTFGHFALVTMRCLAVSLRGQRRTLWSQAERVPAGDACLQCFGCCERRRSETVPTALHGAFPPLSCNQGNIGGMPRFACTFWRLAIARFPAYTASIHALPFVHNMATYDCSRMGNEDTSANKTRRHKRGRLPLLCPC